MDEDPSEITGWPDSKGHKSDGSFLHLKHHISLGDGRENLKNKKYSKRENDFKML